MGRFSATFCFICLKHGICWNIERGSRCTGILCCVPVSDKPNHPDDPVFSFKLPSPPHSFSLVFFLSPRIQRFAEPAENTWKRGKRIISDGENNGGCNHCNCCDYYLASAIPPLPYRPLKGAQHLGLNLRRLMPQANRRKIACGEISYRRRETLRRMQE